MCDLVLQYLIYFWHCSAAPQRWGILVFAKRRPGKAAGMKVAGTGSLGMPISSDPSSLFARFIKPRIVQIKLAKLNGSWLGIYHSIHAACQNYYLLQPLHTPALTFWKNIPTMFTRTIRSNYPRCTQIILDSLVHNNNKVTVLILLI